MDISTCIDQQVFNVTCSGKFTFDDHLEFRNILLSMEEGQYLQVILHMDGVDFIDSAALGMLLLALDTAEKGKKRLTLSGARGQVRKILDLAKFHAMFEIV